MTGRRAGAERLVLASTSPRRHQILQQLGLSFVVVPPAVDEASVVGDGPAETARLRAVRKAESVAAGALAAGAGEPPPLVLGADTLVARGDRIYGKPAGAAEAEAMLAELAGAEHRVWSGIAIVGARGTWSRSVCTRVWLRPLTADAIAAYVATGEPLDKAGAYAAQGRGAALVRRVSGCFWNVVGLPVAALADGLSTFGVSVFGGPADD